MSSSRAAAEHHDPLTTHHSSLITRIVTAAEMKALEAEAGRLGVPEPALMARAGAAVAEVVQRVAPAGPIVALVGTGNNGGDALVAASHLLTAGRAVTLWTAPNRRAGLPVPEAALAGAQVAPDLPALAAALDQAAAVVDGLYGTGVSRPIEGIPAEAVAAVNAARARPDGPLVVAIDLPSGIMADTGQVARQAIRADLTVALGYPKRGLFLGAGARHAGRLERVDIGLPEGIEVTDGPQAITREQVQARLPRREATADKRDVGAAIVVGGAFTYPGAPRLAALGAMRAGAGYVTLAVPRSIFPIVASTLLEATYLPLPETDGDLRAAAAEALGKELGRYQALVLGCGLGREEGTAEFVEHLVGAASRRKGTLGFGREVARHLEVVGQRRPSAADGAPDRLLPEGLKLVVDADGLILLSEIEGWYERLPAPAVLTPNLREMARLTGETVEAIEAEPWRVTQEAAARWGHVVVLKKGHSVVATPDGRLWAAEQAAPALATAGSGDVLSGVIGGLLAQGLAPVDAAVAALGLGTLAADLGAARVGVAGLLAGDLPLLVAEAMRDLARGVR